MIVQDDLALQKLREIGASALAELFEENRTRLEWLINFRMDRRLRGRIDASDVMQESYLRCGQRMNEYLANPTTIPFVWIREITIQSLVDLRRFHFGQKRHPGREKGGNDFVRDSTSLSIADYLSAGETSPSGKLMKAEEFAQLHQLIEAMGELDREVLALRHFEQLSNVETAQVLGLSQTAASNRYVRAMKHLKEVLDQVRHSEK